MPLLSFRTARPQAVLRLLAPALLLAAPLHAQRGDTAEEWLQSCRASDRGREVFCELRNFDLGALRSLAVDAAPNGGIRVEGWDRREIRVVARVRAQGESAAAAREVAGAVAISTDDGRVRARGPRDLGGRRGWSVSYDVYVPRQIDLDLNSTNGGIAVSGVRGRLEMETTNGGIALSGIAGDVRGETTNGGLSVRLSGSGWEGRGLDLSTTNGGISLDVPEGYSANLQASTTNGGISTDLPLTVQGRWGKRMEGRLGRGGAPIQLTTTNGRIRVRRR